MSIRGLQLALGPVAKTYATYDNGNKGASVSLSGGDLTASWAGGANPAVRANQGKTGGKHYWETAFTSIGSAFWDGFVNGTFNITGADVLNTTNAWSIRNNGDVLNNGGGAGTYTAYSAGKILMHAVNLDASKWWAGVDGTWFNSGDPAAGTGAIVTSGISGTIYPAGSSNVGSTVVVAKYGPSFTYTPPTGFRKGWYLP